MKNYKKPVSCNVSSVSTGLIPFALGALAGAAIQAAAIGAAAAVGASVGSKLSGDDFTIRFKPIDASPMKLGVV